MKKIYKYVVSVSCFVLVLGFTDVKAEKSEAVIVSIVADEVEDAEWHTDQEKLKKLMTLEKLENFSDQESCQEIWDILWFWAKKGNLEARANLFMLNDFVWLGLPRMFLPGRSGDDLSAQRDAIILSIHSIGDPDSLKGIDYKGYEERLNSLYGRALKEIGSSFLWCLENKQREFCSYAASRYLNQTNIKLIPTFEEYAVEIDMFIARGMKPKCGYFYTDNLFKGQKRKHEEPLKKQGD